MKTKKAYSYIRFSTPEQAQGRSQHRQYEQCQKYCADHGLELALDEEYKFFDSGLSAYKGDHLSEKGALRRFLNLVEDGSIERGSYLIVESLDRLSRANVTDALLRFIALLKQGINIVTLSDGNLYKEDFSDHQLIMSIFVMSRAHEESTLKSKRIGDAWRVKQVKARETLKPIGKGVPLWLKLTETGYEVIEERADVIREIYRLALGGYGRDKIAQIINQANLLSFNGKTWGGSSVASILASRSIIGEYQPFSTRTGKREPSGDAIKGYFPAVIDEATFYEVRAAVEGRRAAKGTKQTKGFQVWQGVAKCTLCSTAMHLVIQGKYLYLKCYKARKGVCSGKAIPLLKSEEVFKEMLAKVDALPLVQGNSKSIEKKLAEIEGKLLEEKPKVDEYKVALKGRVSETITDLIIESEEKISSLKAQKKNLENELKLETIVSKEHFFSKLDLKSYDGRHRANALLKRLKITVYMEVVDKSRTDYIVFQNASPIFAFGMTKDEGIVFTPLNQQQVERAQVQDYDGSDASALRIFLSEVILNHGTTADKTADDIFKRLGIITKTGG